MAKKQTRRSISVNRTLFEHAKTVAAFNGVSLSSFTEAALREKMAREAAENEKLVKQVEATA